MKVNLTTLIAVCVMALITGILISGARLPFADEPKEHVQAQEPKELPQIETIFVALDQTAVPVPVNRSGNGGALVSFGNDLVVMTHEGRFFDVTGDTALPLSIAPPDNGWDEMLAFDAAVAAFELAAPK